MSPRVPRYHDDDVASGTAAEVKQKAERTEGKVGPLSPSRSEPILDGTGAEASLPSTVGLSASVAVATNSQQRKATMPSTQEARSPGIPTTDLPTFHEYMGSFHKEITPPTKVAPPTDTTHPVREYEELILDFEMVETPI